METLTWLSVLPPILVVILAVSTRNIIFSLLMGIVFGLGIYGAVAPPGALEGRNVLDMTIYGLKMMVSAAGTPKNLLLIFFLVMLGGLIAILTAAGCANSFSASAVRMIRGKRSAEGFTFLLGCVIFVDDYFNAITVGNVMVPITDKFKISRAKLAYLIDSTSAPVTILMPVSSWVATVISLSVPELARYGIEVPGMQAFLSATVFNAYAWLTLLMVVAVIVFRADIGPMKRYEDDYARTGVDTSIFVDINESVIDDMGVRQKGTAADMLITIISLVAATFMVMLYTGGFFTEGRGIQDALMYCDPDSSLASAVLIALVICFALLVGRRKMGFSRFNEAFINGVKSMVTSVIILVLSWSFSELLGSSMLGTGACIAAALGGWLPGWALPAAIFVISALISFSTGSSWGAMGIMLPTSIAVCAAVDPSYMYMVLGAGLSGCVFGDHCSPLADTTVLSSAGAGCKHLAHVTTQLPYAAITGVISIAAFIAVGLTGSAIISYLGASLAIITLCFTIGKKNKTAVR